MKITSSTELVNKALKEIKTITTDEAYSKMLEAKSNMIDIRDIRELQNEGKVEGAVHIPRGMLEFWLDPESVYFKEGKCGNEIMNKMYKMYIFICRNIFNIYVQFKLTDRITNKLWVILLINNIIIP